MPLLFCFRCLMLSYNPCLYRPRTVQLCIPRYQQHIHEYNLYNTSWFKHKIPHFASHECRMQYSNSNVTFCLVSCWPPWTVDEDDTASFFVKELGPALAPKMFPDQSQAFKEVNHSQAFTAGRKKIPCFFQWPFFFWTSLFQVFQGIFCTEFRANIKMREIPPSGNKNGTR